MWGMIDYRAEHGCVMVVPVDKKGNVLPPHILSEDCICEPDAEYHSETGYYVVVHHGPDNV